VYLEIVMSTTEAIMQKVITLPQEKQEQVLRFAESLAGAPSHPQKSEPGSSLRRFAALKLEGPADASSRFHENLYGENARDGQ
jgi:hypothetical protein